MQYFYSKSQLAANHVKSLSPAFSTVSLPFTNIAICVEYLRPEKLLENISKLFSHHSIPHE